MLRPTWGWRGSWDLNERYDLSGADQERSEEISEVFIDLAAGLIEDGEEVDDVVYAMAMTITWIMSVKQAADAVIN